jgi:hypothetical protein
MGPDLDNTIRNHPATHEFEESKNADLRQAPRQSAAQQQAGGNLTKTNKRIALWHTGTESAGSRTRPPAEEKGLGGGSREARAPDGDESAAAASSRPSFQFQSLMPERDPSVRPPRLARRVHMRPQSRVASGPVQDPLRGG